MKTLWSTGAAAILLGASWVPLTAQAAMMDISQWQPYIGGQLSSQHLKYDDISSSFTFGSVGIDAGINLNSFLALEARLGKSFNNNELIGYKFKIEHYYGLYLKLGLPTATIFTPYGIIGETKLKVKSEGSTSLLGDLSASDSDHDFSWGVGLQAAVSQHVAMTLEYMNMYDKDSAKLRSLAIAINYVF